MSPPASPCCESTKPWPAVCTRPPTKSRAPTTNTLPPHAARSRAAHRPASPPPATSTETPVRSPATSPSRQRHRALNFSGKTGSPADKLCPPWVGKSGGIGMTCRSPTMSGRRVILNSELQLFYLVALRLQHLQQSVRADEMRGADHDKRRVGSRK